METIQIALASDANYFPGLLVTTVSIARNASHENAIVFNILDGGLKSEQIDFLRTRLEAEHPYVTVKNFSVNEANFSSFPAWNSGSRMPYVRILLPEILKEEDFVIYTDVDFLWTADIAELWALRDECHLIQGCVDRWLNTVQREGKWFAAHGINIDLSRYICTGMMIMNLKRFRNEDMARTTIDFLEKYKDVEMVDQTAINAVAKDSTGILPSKWGRFSRELKAKEVPGEWAIHFAGSAPWLSKWWTSLISPADLMWYRLYGELTGLTSSEARRKFIGDGEYLKRRSAYFLVHTPLIRQLFFAFLRIIGRGLYIPDLVGRRV